MFRNYVTTAAKNLLADKLYSAINILGLAFGLAATILIALYVLDETSYDRQWANTGRIYRINTDMYSNSGDFVRRAGVAMPVVPALQRFFPGEIETGARLMALDSEVFVGTARFEETVTRVDRGFLDMFNLQPVAGRLAKALSDPAKVALRADVAQRFFGVRESFADIVGEVVSVSYNGAVRDYEVAAVYRFPAGNSVLDLPMLTYLDESAFPPALLANWGALAVSAYLQLAPGVDVATVSARLEQFTDQSADISSMQAGPDITPSDRLRFDLQNLAAIHLNSPFDNSRAGGNRTVVIAFTAIAVLVLLIGIINFTILSTAKATKRAKETALRKTVGASRGELIRQFIGESFCIVLPAMLASGVVVELLLPVFETMVGKALQISWFAPGTLLALALLYVVVSLLGGLYPAFVLSRFRPAETLRATRVSESSASPGLRNLLVTFQFGVSIALIIATGVIYAQVRYVLARDPGFNRENLVVIDNLLQRPEVNAAKDALKTQLLNIDGVIDAAFSSHQPTQTGGRANYTAPYSVPGQDSASQSIVTLGVDPDFFGTYEIGIVAGRSFSADIDQPAEIFPQQSGGPDPARIMLNVSAARLLGFTSPEAAVGSVVYFSRSGTGSGHDLTVIGVAADTNFHSMNAVPRPEVYSYSPGFTDVLSLRVDGSSQALMDQISTVWRSVMGDAELSMGFVEQNMQAEFTQERVEAQLLVGFSLLAVIIACMGLYGSAAFTVERRTKEIGIRKALGAEVREIVTMLVWQFSRPVLLANAIAWPLAAWSMLVWLQRFPYRIDALVLVPLCVLAGAVALSIAWLTVAGNTVRVASTRPVLALRYE